MNTKNVISATEFLDMIGQGKPTKADVPSQITAEQYRTKYVPRHTVLNEHQIQSALVDWFRDAYPGLLLFAIPNGGKLPYKTIEKKGKKVHVSPERTKLIEEGMVSGIPDLMLAVPKGDFHGLFVEMKTERGVVSDTQATIHAYLRGQGYEVAVPFGLEPAKQAIINYLNLP